MKKWYRGVKNSDVGNRCKCSEVTGVIVGVYCSARCLVQNDNGTLHVQPRSNVMVLR